jgi:arylsulfate sulfotransferase
MSDKALQKEATLALRRSPAPVGRIFGLHPHQTNTKPVKTMNNPLMSSLPRTLRKPAAVLVVMATVSNSKAVKTVAVPYFAPASNAPLAGVLTVTTDVNSLVEVSVNDGIGTWERDFFDYGTNHTETVLGFKAGRTNQITVTVRDQYRNSYTVPGTLTFLTGPLPADMAPMTVLTDNVELMEPGYTLFRESYGATTVAYTVIVDNTGQVVWYSGALAAASDVHQLPNGNLFYPVTGGTGFAEANMLGQAVQEWTAPTTVDTHEDLLTGHGTILYLNYVTDTVSNFPSSATDPTAPTETANAVFAQVIEMSATNSELLNSWQLIDMLDPVRIDYLCYGLVAEFGIDPEHANAIFEDTNDNSIIVSLRNQDAVVKFTRSGQIKWILGPHENWGPEWQPYLLTPVGTPFEWNYAQHAPILTSQGTLLLYDDGNERAEPFDPPIPYLTEYSRAAEFSIDETNMEVSQVWEFSDTNAEPLYTTALGNATLLPKTSNVLVNFGFIVLDNGAPPNQFAPNATAVRIREVTHQANPTVVFDLELADTGNTSTNYLGYEVYRSYRIPDLYSHPASPVAGLTVQLAAGTPFLQFTADPARSYVVQSSSDLIHWQVIGSALPDDGSGDFSFQDAGGDGNSAEFYRVLTQ